MKDTTADKNLMTAVFNSSEAAARAYQELSNRGYKYNEISVLMSEETCSQFQNNKTEVEENEDASAVPALEKATPGAIIVALVAVGVNIILPGAALIVTGPLASSLVTANGISSGLAGALTGSGIPGEAARVYERGVSLGGILLGFNPHNSSDFREIENIWKTYKGELILSLHADF